MNTIRYAIGMAVLCGLSSLAQEDAPLVLEAPNKATNAQIWSYWGDVPRGYDLYTNVYSPSSGTHAFRIYRVVGTNDADFVIVVGDNPDTGIHAAALIFNSGACRPNTGLPSEWVMTAQTLYFASGRFLYGFPTDTEASGGIPGLCASLVLRNQAPGRDGYSVPIRFEATDKKGNSHYPGFFSQDLGTNGYRLVLGDIPYSTTQNPWVPGKVASPWCAQPSNTTPWAYFTPKGLELKGGLIVNGWKLNISNTGLVSAERVVPKPSARLPLASPKQSSL